jgi:hypothetical protein
MEETAKIVLPPNAEGVIRCRACGQTSICHAGDCDLYARQGWPRCPIDGTEMRFIPRAELKADTRVILPEQS